MRTLKKSALVVLALLMIALTACGDTSIPDGMDETALYNAGKDIFLSLVDGDYETVYYKLRLDQRELYTEDDIRDVVTAQLDSAGEYKYISDHMIHGQTIQGTRYAIVTLYCEFSEKNIVAQFSFDAEMHLVGLSMDQQ